MGKFGALLACQTGPITSIGLGLMYPRPHCRFTEVEVPSQLADAAVTVLITLDDLSLELRSERPSGTGLLPLHGLHCEHPFRGDAPDGGCPSNRRRPTRTARSCWRSTPSRPSTGST